MPLFCASHATQLPHNLVVRRKNLTSKHVSVLLLSSSKCCLAASSSKVGLSENAASLSGTSPSIMEVEKLGIISSEIEEYSTELDVAVRIVQMACFLCQRVQESLIPKGNNQVKSKDDNSPVTVAGRFMVLVNGRDRSCRCCSGSNLLASTRRKKGALTPAKMRKKKQKNIKNEKNLPPVNKSIGVIVGVNRRNSKEAISGEFLEDRIEVF
ncbi:PREDICTED: uncharacterized protein LOC104602992 isoform X1 [Nelumbo nucifera]|uniref:Uncharacterized protein LOC104602992 isoform X1 n=1 Tax=Nelumbo nucifera TaxID=4432 RepID=A0A1U8AQG1_NELNU|nr:PREDICTED: uncharacterized protein LOC104602992 isoform X1 [Nelumbo nucifera]